MNIQIAGSNEVINELLLSKHIYEIGFTTTSKKLEAKTQY